MPERGHAKFLKLLAWCLLLTLAWGVWLWRLDASDLTFDESATYFVAYRPPLQILQYLRGAIHEHPPVYYLLIRGWMALAGTSEFSLRLFSTAAGLIAVSLTGWLAQLTASRLTGLPPAGVGLVAGILLAITPGTIHYARDARMYTLGMVWTALAAGLFMRDWVDSDARPRRVTILLLTVVNGLAFLTHYYLLLPVVTQPLALLVGRRWRAFWAWSGAHAFPALLGLIWIWLATGLQLSAASIWTDLELAIPSSFKAGVLLDRVFFSSTIGVQFRYLTTVLLLILAGMLVALWRNKRAGTWLAAALVTPLPIAYLIPLQPAPRYLLFLLPFASLAMALFALFPSSLAKSRWQGIGASIGLTLFAAWVLAGVGFRPVLTTIKSRYGHTMELIKAHSRPGDEVLFYGPWQTILFHYYNPGDMPPITIVPARAPPVLAPEEAQPLLEDVVERSERLWVIPAAVDQVDPDHFVRNWLDKNMHGVWKDEEFQLYMPPLQSDASVQYPGWNFQQTLLLDKVAYNSQPIKAGEPLRLVLHWRFLNQPENDVLLFLSLVDSIGHVWDSKYASAMIDINLPDATTYEGLMVPQGAPPGDYSVRLRVIDVATDEFLPAEGATESTLAKIQVSDPDTDPVLNHLAHLESTTFCEPQKERCLTLAAAEPGGLHFQPGFPVPLTLHWLSPTEALPPLEVRLHLVPRRVIDFLSLSRVPTFTHTSLLSSSYSPTKWNAGRLISMPTALHLPPDTPTGRHDILLEVMEPNSHPWLTSEGNSVTQLFPIIVEERPTQRQLPGGLDAIFVDFGEDIALRGFRVQGDPGPGCQLQLTYAWYTRRQPTGIYAVFNHLTEANGMLVAQVDGWPQQGRLLTSQWQRGEYIEDSYTLDIPEGAPPGPYTLYVGLYDAANDSRLQAFQDGQRVTDDRFPISLPEESERPCQ